MPIVAVLVLSIGVIPAFAQSSDVIATGNVCTLDITPNPHTDQIIMDFGFSRDLNFGTLNHGDTVTTLESSLVPGTFTHNQLDIVNSGDQPVVVELVFDDWRDFDGNFVMNANQTRFGLDTQDDFNNYPPTNSTDSITVPVHTDLEVATGQTTKVYFGLEVDIDDDTFQGSIFQTLNVNFTC